MARKSFTVDAQPKEVIEFDLEFKTHFLKEDGSTEIIRDTETFTCIDDIPGGVMTDFSEYVSRSEIGGLAGMLKVIEGVLIDEDVPRFRAVIHSKEKIVNLDTLGDILEWVIEQYADRPTKRPSRSSRGPQPQRTADISRVGSY